MHSVAPRAPLEGSGAKASAEASIISIVEVRGFLLECKANFTRAREYNTMHHRLRRIVVALCLALAAAGVHADELQDINRMMKQGQLPQALERIDKPASLVTRRADFSKA